MAWKIGGIFGRSPFGPVHEHLVKARACVELLPVIVDAMADGRIEEVRKLADEVHRHEHEADLIKTDIRNQLSLSIFSAPQRAEIMTLLRVQDNVADRAEEAAGLMELRNTKVPDGMKEELRLLARGVKSACEVVVAVEARIADAESIVEAELVKEVKAKLDPFYDQAHQGSIASRKALAKVFEFESEIDPVSVIFLMQIIALLNRVSDELENTADVLARLIEH